MAGLASGSGKTLRSALELQRILDATTGGSPFEVVALFSDSNGAECLAWAEEEGLPSFCLDIRDYYSDRGVPLKDMRARADYDREVLRLLQGCAPDMLLLAGYVWAVTDVVTGSIMTVGVHPADLAIQKDGHRAYAGADGVGATLAGRCSSFSFSRCCRSRSR